MNENSNGLLRQYLPKGMKLADFTEEQVREAVERINHRPRKTLGFRTPHEVFFGGELRYTKQPLAVALRTCIHGVIFRRFSGVMTMPVDKICVRQRAAV